MYARWHIRRSAYTGKILDRRTALTGDTPVIYLTAWEHAPQWVLEIHLGSRMKAPENTLRFDTLTQIQDLVLEAEDTEDPYTHLLGDQP